MAKPVDLVVPVKELDRAKSRLQRPGWSGAERRELALAIARDTLRTAAATEGVRRVLAVSSDSEASSALRADGIEVVPDLPAHGLNAALRYGAGLLLAADRSARVGALPADLPALRRCELAAALGCEPGRAFCPDRSGSGTTLLLAAPAAVLDPRFGPDSAAAHAASGADRLAGDWPGLRCDVDTADDLAEAVRLGVGPTTRRVLALAGRPLCR